MSLDSMVRISRGHLEDLPRIQSDYGLPYVLLRGGQLHQIVNGQDCRELREQQQQSNKLRISCEQESQNAA